MSSTKRKKKGPAFDYYPTPKWCVTRLLEKVNFRTSNSHWLEPAVGDCSIIDAVNEYCEIKNQPKPNWSGLEIQPGFEEAIKQRSINYQIGDFFNRSLNLGNPNIVITNPPFSSALEFIKRAIELQPEYVCMLLRLNFLGSEERSSYLREHTPDIYVIPNRPSFNGGKTDSIEYAWLVWSSRNNYGLNQNGSMCILNSTNKNERKKK